MAHRPSPSQLEGLVEFLEDNSGIAKGLLRTAQAKIETKKKWALLAISLNSLGGAHKDGPAWAKYWAEKKCAVKKLCAQNLASFRQTGGGTGQTHILSELDKRFVAVMGGVTFASGDTQLTINPFPQTSAESRGTTPQPLMDEEIRLEDDLPEYSAELLSPCTITPAPPAPPTASAQATTSSAPSSLRPLPPRSSNAPAAAPSASQRRPRRSVPRSVDVEMDRMAIMEEKRIEAERLTAEAFVETSKRLEKLSEAGEHIAQAVMEVANALHQIANNLRT